jgi:hypothetical protein
MNRLGLLALAFLVTQAFAEPVRNRKSYPAASVSVLTAVADGHHFLGVFYRDPKAIKSSLTLIAEVDGVQNVFKDQLSAAVKDGQWVALAVDGSGFDMVPPPVEDTEIALLKSEVRSLKAALANCQSEKQRVIDEQPTETTTTPQPSNPVDEKPVQEPKDPDEIIPGMPKKRF